MTHKKNKDSTRKSLEYSVKDGAAFSVMTGFGEQYLNPLAIELGASNIQISLLASIPPFIASLCQLYTSRLMERIKSRRQMILNFVMLQALTWIPLALIPLLDLTGRVTWLIVFVSLYFVFGQFVGPVWNSLMGDLVEENKRGRFFGMRNKVSGAVAFASLFTAGFVLSRFPQDKLFYGFTVIFTVAFIARIASWLYLKRMDDPHVIFDKKASFSFPQYVRKLKETNYGKFALYQGFMNFSVQLAGPFFAVYMLRDLHLSYLEYTAVTASAALTSFLAMTYWGTIADRCGNKSILNVCGVLVVIVPLLWLYSGNVTYLILIQTVSGFAWAGFNLSSANFIFDNVSAVKRTRVFSYHNVLQGSLVFLGALSGGVLSRVFSSPWIFASSLQILFLVSGLMRALTSLFFLPRIQEVRDVEPITPKTFFMKYSGTQPVLGMTFKTIIGFHKSLTNIRKRRRH
ncbi:MAG: MFS transporter [Candidatus Altiarchaeota archaeon]